MEELFERLGALNPAARIGILVVILGALIGGYYQVFYSDLAAERTSLETQIAAAKKERASYEQRKKERQAYMLEIQSLMDEQKELLGVLPTKDDIEQFIENIYSQIELSGLTRVSSVRDPEMQEEMYMRIPIKMSLIGSYHQINRFFKNVSDLKRIVTISDLQLKPSDVKETPPGSLRADFVAYTFYFVDHPQAAPTGPGSITVGGPAR